MTHLVITISRQYGSGGREIGASVAERLSISCYDKTLLQLAAEQSGLSPEFIEKTEEQAASSFLFNLSAATVTGSGNFFYQYNVPVSDQAFFAQTSVIRGLAASESCVIVGRCANYILGTQARCLKVFLHAPLEARIARIAQSQGLSEKEAKDHIHRVDKGRANYYRHYTGGTWGETEAYDLCINTQTASPKGATAAILAMAELM
ncbi:MAG: cytidylate kinase-like family protein [Oscillospiraceae bacterium]|nr:cytidylate kinase-like family protein [Oscillospiraceae bacterium]